METSAWVLLGAFLLVLGVLAWPTGRALAALCDGRLPGWMKRAEAPLFRLAGVDAGASMHWHGYALALLAFNALGVLVVYALQRLQALLPLNPASLGAVSPDSAFNTAVSFATNTNWQGYGGESTMSYLTQMLGLSVQNFLSAATGIAVAFALARGFAARHTDGQGRVGNFWVDVTRITLWLLLPIALLLALFFVQQGVIQNFHAYQTVHTLEGASQTLAMGPVASQEAIKMLGTNGGGFFNANSAHPFENPTALSNFVQMLSIFLIPAGLCFAFGRVVGDLRQGWAVLAAMTAIFVVAVVVLTHAEQAGNPRLAALGVDAVHGAVQGVQQAGGNMEGKEVRFGIDASSLFAAVTTAASCGAVIAMHESLTPLGGMVPMVLMQLGEVVFGGVGSGLYGMLVFAILAVFIAGLMIGRTPEYLGKKIEVHEMKLTSIAILITPILVLVGTAIAVGAAPGRAGIGSPGAHGFSEVLYALSSAGNNNGSAFAALSANSPFYNALLGVVMWLGRFAMIVPVLAIAGALAAKKRLPETAGTMPTHGPLFVILLIGTVLLVGLLNYVPALALGPMVEHLMLWKAAS
ncbi:MAG: potassium-transporting ATPase subunit KdpA [Gammaproteobacteria bacterium]|nr:potassium-transporting ATPase subunit KdpA [Gammaproteobacteria bacterium]MBU1444091.1 potassium-transporting ATPase subunit KdpA [Gammaproteobacteria bacterium]MBU2410810.1 potassium-transporting ATPase subunit KdpA [Gammaproteobacteria bacterium]